MNQPKAGYKTTEFWMSAIAVIVGLAFAAGVFPAESSGDKLLGLAASVLASMGYAVSRGIAKK